MRKLVARTTCSWMLVLGMLAPDAIAVTSREARWSPPSQSSSRKSATAAPVAKGAYRYASNRLTIAHGCAVSLPGPSTGLRTFVVLSDRQFDCAAAAKSRDPEETVKNALRDAMQGSVRFWVGVDGKIESGAIYFSTWQPLDSFTAQNAYEATLAPAQPGRIAGTLRTNGVKKIEMATTRELEVNVTFDLPVIPSPARP